MVDTEKEKDINVEFTSGKSFTQYLLGICVALIVFIYLDMRSTVKEIADDIKTMTTNMNTIGNTMIRVETQVDVNTRELRRLDEKKVDRK